MLTIFSVPRPFKGHSNIIQRNAIQSWTFLRPKCEIILFCNEEGTAEIAAEFGLKYVPELEKNEFGTPFLNDAYNKAQKMAIYPMVAYVNTDIILLQDFIAAFQKINFPKFMMVGRRWSLELKKEINFGEPDWDVKLIKLLKKEGRRFSPSAMDYCVFPRNFKLNLPPFTVGRSGGSDSWQLYRARSLGIPIIDVTEATMVIHQDHDNASYYFGGRKGGRKKIETQRNIKLRPKFYNTLTIRDADWVFTKERLKKRKLFPPLQFLYHCCGGLLTFYPFLSFWQKLFLFPLWFTTTTAEQIRDIYLKKGKFWIK